MTKPSLWFVEIRDECGEWQEFDANPYHSEEDANMAISYYASDRKRVFRASEYRRVAERRGRKGNADKG